MFSGPGDIWCDDYDERMSRSEWIEERTEELRTGWLKSTDMREQTGYTDEQRIRQTLTLWAIRQATGEYDNER